LLTDDDPDVRRLLSRILEQAGYRVVEAGSGREATDALGSEPFDLLIIDLSMPEQDGWETIRAIRGANSEVKILAISGFFTPEFLTMSRYEGADAALQKPIAPESLLRTVQQLLDLSRSTARERG
jgi:CheY-like chemotaxis protein